MKRTLAEVKFSHLLRLVLFQGFICLTACSTIESTPVEQPYFSIRQDEVFGVRPDIIGVQEIHQLT